MPTLTDAEVVARWDWINRENEIERRGTQIYNNFRVLGNALTRAESWIDGPT